MNRITKKRRAVKKGKSFEGNVARELRALDPKARRCLQYQRQHGAPDVECGPLWIECKARRVPVAAVYEATVEAAKARPGTIPVVVSKTSPRGPRLVSMDLRDFVTLAAFSPLMKSQRTKTTEKPGPVEAVVTFKRLAQFQVLQNLLLLASRKATLTVLRSWTVGQRRAAEEWAAKSYARASDNPVKMPPIPPHVAQLPEVR